MNSVATQRLAVATMSRKANELDVGGVAVALVTDVSLPVLLEPAFIVVGKFQRGPRDDDPNDTGTNYAAVAWSKLAEMLATRVDSGTDKDRRPKKGECGWPGGVVAREGEFLLLTAFSGGTGEEDVKIAKAGLESLRNSIAKFNLATTLTGGTDLA